MGGLERHRADPRAGSQSDHVCSSLKVVAAPNSAHEHLALELLVYFVEKFHDVAVLFSKVAYLVYPASLTRCLCTGLAEKL